MSSFGPDQRVPLQGERIAVVGAGISGLAAGRRLAQHGAEVTVYEATAAAGGRLASSGDPPVDVGAQYVTQREPSFKAFLARARLDGAVAAWEPAGKDRDEEWIVGLPTMAGLVAPLAAGVKIVLGAAVESIVREGQGYALAFADRRPPVLADRAVVALPAPAAAPLLAGFGAPFQPLAEVRMAPCWTLVAEFDQPPAGPDVRRAAGNLQWIARNASKPGRKDGSIVAQASPAWSMAHLEAAEADVARLLAAELATALGAAVPAKARALLWRHALVERAVGELFLATPDRTLGACGDWCTAPRVESAYASGDSLADAMAAARQDPKPA